MRNDYEGNAIPKNPGYCIRGNPFPSSLKLQRWNLHSRFILRYKLSREIDEEIEWIKMYVDFILLNSLAEYIFQLPLY